MKPLIGIVGKPYKGERWNYIQEVDEIREALIKNGAKVIGIVPQTISINANYISYPYYEDYEMSDMKDLEEIIDLCDGIVLQGGGVACNYERYIVSYCIEKDIPLLGICCGMLNMAKGANGKIEYVDKEYMREKHMDLENMHKHKVIIDRSSLLYKIIQKETIITNSIHSGRVTDSGLYEIIAKAEDGIVEALEYKENKFNLGLQWHPELMYKEDKEQEQIFKYFINACKENSFSIGKLL